MIELSGGIRLAPGEFYYLDDMIRRLYDVIVNDNVTDLNQIKVLCYLSNVVVTTFRLRYRTGLVLYNESSNIKLTNICPELTSIDMLLEKFLGKNTHKQSESESTLTTSTVKPRHQKFLQKARIVNRPCEVKIIDQQNNLVQLHTEPEVEQTRPKVEPNVEPQLSQKLHSFQTDKITYVKIKKDIEDGKLNEDDIHPAFMLKYQIFKLLDARQNLNLDNDNNLSQEGEIFSELYDELMSEFQKEIQNESMNEEKVYVPYNYHYLSDDKKEEHARKYKMTRQEFENKYVYGLVNDEEGQTVEETVIEL